MNRYVINLGELAAAHTILQEMVGLWRASGRAYELALALRRLAQAACLQGDLLTARRQDMEALQIFRSLHERWAIAQSLLWLSRITWRQGDKTQAIAFLEENLTLTRALEAKEFLSGSLLLLGLAAQEQGAQPRAWALLRECLVINQEHDILYRPESQDFAAYLLTGFAGLLLEPMQSATLLGVVGKLLSTPTGLPDFATEHSHYARILTAGRTQLTDAAFAAAYATGQAMSLANAVELALAQSPIRNGQAICCP